MTATRLDKELKRILYLSYDGLTDNLGQSQIIPYLNELYEAGFDLTVISVDKPVVYAQRKDQVKDQIRDGIEWVSVPYHKKPPIVSTAWDLWNMRKVAQKVVKNKRIDLIHVRSYPPMGIALGLKRRFRCKVLFDMRGFYPEERIEGGIWSMDNPVHRLIFKRLKKQEAEFFRQSDHIISLTHKAKKILSRERGFSENKISVIPCCADFEHFAVRPTPEVSERLEVLYLGSLGTWYLIPEMMVFFKRILEEFPNARLTIVTGDGTQQIADLNLKYDIPPTAVRCIKGLREEIPTLISACDLSIFLIKNSFSKSASSPTKLAEILACGKPVICNSGVGDLAELSTDLMGLKAFELKRMSEIELSVVIKELLALPGEEIRERSREKLSLETAASTYIKVYKKLLGGDDIKSRFSHSQEYSKSL